MGRRRFEEMNCGIAQALEAFGDWWTLLIVRDAFFGASRFGEFQKSLGISSNILTNRLDHLVEHEILQRVSIGTHGERYEYSLTRKGEELLPVLMAMRDWSDRWVFGKGKEPLVFRDRRTGKRLPRMVPRDADGCAVGPKDLSAEAGPGADKTNRTDNTRTAKPSRRKG